MRSASPPPPRPTNETFAILHLSTRSDSTTSPPTSHLVVNPTHSFFVTENNEADGYAQSCFRVMSELVISTSSDNTDDELNCGAVVIASISLNYDSSSSSGRSGVSTGGDNKGSNNVEINITNSLDDGTEKVEQMEKEVQKKSKKDDNGSGQQVTRGTLLWILATSNTQDPRCSSLGGTFEFDQGGVIHCSTIDGKNSMVALLLKEKSDESSSGGGSRTHKSLSAHFSNPEEGGLEHPHDAMESATDDEVTLLWMTSGHPSYPLLAKTVTTTSISRSSSGQLGGDDGNYSHEHSNNDLCAGFNGRGSSLSWLSSSHLADGDFSSVLERQDVAFPYGMAGNVLSVYDSKRHAGGNYTLGRSSTPTCSSSGGSRSSSSVWKATQFHVTVVIGAVVLAGIMVAALAYLFVQAPPYMNNLRAQHSQRKKTQDRLNEKRRNRRHSDSHGNDDGEGGGGSVYALSTTLKPRGDAPPTDLLLPLLEQGDGEGIYCSKEAGADREERRGEEENSDGGWRGGGEGEGKAKGKSVNTSQGGGKGKGKGHTVVKEEHNPIVTYFKGEKHTKPLLDFSDEENT